jgi:hypothetical protein
VDTHRLIPVLGDELLSGLVPIRPHGASRQQVLVRLSAPIEDVALELVPERWVHDRKRLNLPALLLRPSVNPVERRGPEETSPAVDTLQLAGQEDTP